MIRRCENYSEKIREIIRTWQEKNNRIKKARAIKTVGPEFAIQGKGYTSFLPSSLPYTTEMIQQPSNLVNQIRPYQLIGLNWLYLLFQQKINGILADESKFEKIKKTYN